MPDVTLDDLLRALDLLDEQASLPPLLRRLALRGLVSEVKDLLPAQDELDFNDEAMTLADRGQAMIRQGEADRQRGEHLVCLASLMTQLR